MNKTVSTTLIAPLWVLASMVQLGLSRPGGEGKEVQFPAPPVLLLLSELWFDDQPKPPLPHPSSLFYLRLVTFCYFSSSHTRFRPLLIRFSIARIVHFVKMSFYYQRLKLLNFFPPRTNVNAENPEFALSDPSNFWKIHGNPLRILFICFCFTNTFNMV